MRTRDGARWWRHTAVHIQHACRFYSTPSPTHHQLRRYGRKIAPQHQQHGRLSKMHAARILVSARKKLWCDFFSLPKSTMRPPARPFGNSLWKPLFSCETQTHLVDGHLAGDRHRLGSRKLSVQHTVEVVSRRPVHERTKRACRARVESIESIAAVRAAERSRPSPSASKEPNDSAQKAFTGR